jgi:hypothetical protein
LKVLPKTQRYIEYSMEKTLKESSPAKPAKWLGSRAYGDCLRPNWGWVPMCWGRVRGIPRRSLMLSVQNEHQPQPVWKLDGPQFWNQSMLRSIIERQKRATKLSGAIFYRHRQSWK